VIVLNVARGADITKLLFLDAERLGVCASKSKPYRKLPASLWSVPTGARVEFQNPGFDDDNVGQLRAGEWLFGASGQRHVLVAHNPQTGQYVSEPVGGTIVDLALAPGAGTVLFSMRDAETGRERYESRAWSHAGAFGPGFRRDFETGDGHSILPLPDGERFVALGLYVINPHIRVRSVSTGKELTAGGPTVLYTMPALACSPDSKRLVAAVQLSLHVYSTDRLEFEKWDVRKDGRKHFTGIAFHPSGKYLAATSNDETVKLYDTATWDVAHTFTWKIGRMRSIAFSPDGALAAAGSDKGQVVVWDVDL